MLWTLTWGETLETGHDVRETGVGELDPDKDLEQQHKTTNHFIVNAANQIPSLGPRAREIYVQ